MLHIIEQPWLMIIQVYISVTNAEDFDFTPNEKIKIIFEMKVMPITQF